MVYKILQKWTEWKEAFTTMPNTYVAIIKLHENSFCYPSQMGAYLPFDREISVTCEEGVGGYTWEYTTGCYYVVTPTNVEEVVAIESLQ